MSLDGCAEWATQSYEQCSAWADRGYNSCNDWDSQCCDWQPCAFFCDLITWVCRGWTWISNFVCVSWTTGTTFACITWEGGAVLAAPATWLIEMSLSVPIFGRVTNGFMNLAHIVIGRGAAVPDLVLSAVGVRPLKKVRLCLIILRDENGVALARPEDASLRAEINMAREIWREQANIEVMVEGIHVIDEPAPSYALDARIGADGFWDELWMTGSYFEQTAATYCPLGGLGRLSVVGKPIVAFRIRSISGGNSGYDPGAASDYILMADIHAKYLACATLAHEMGHKLGLPDCCGPGNLMYNGTCDGLDLKDWQVNLARNSEYSSYV